MGKEWLYWGGTGSRSTKRGGERGNSSSTTPGCMCAVLQLFDFHHFQFPLHQQPSFDPHSFLPEEPTVLKGVEAPRNSLELEQPFMVATSLSSSMKEQQQNLNIPMGIQIKTSGDSSTGSSKARTDHDLSSECSSSPGTKTPNLVARLMGLDLLPESSTPSLSSSSNPLPKSHLHPRPHNLKQEYQSRLQPLQCRSSLFDADIPGTCSLPETPRISSARRSDVDDHRLSLQINKENINGVSEEFEFSGHSSSRTARRRELIIKREDQENRSRSNYARQIVKQVRESVSRRVGFDITNRDEGRDDHEPVFKLKSKKPYSKGGLTRTGDESSSSKQLTVPSCSPRLIRFMERPKNKQNFQSSTKLKTQPLQEHHQQQHQNSTQKPVSERFTPRLKKPSQTSETMRNKKEEPFVHSRTTNIRANHSDKKCKKTPLSIDLLNINVPTLLSVKKDPSPPTTKLRQKQLSSCSSYLYQQEATHTLTAQDSSNDDRTNGATTGDGAEFQLRQKQLSSCPSYLYQQEVTHTLTAQDSSNDDRTNGATTGDGAEFQYISRIIKYSGIDRNTPVWFTRWYSPSHPLDPSIFHLLELSFHSATNSQLSKRCNRKLLFQLVDEILVELLKPHINLKLWVTSITRDYWIMYGSQLIDKLCAKIRSFPSADCRVLEDIDALIDVDLCKLYQQPLLQRSCAFEEEGEGIVSEIERDIVDSLVHETAMEVFGLACPSVRQTQFLRRE